MSVNRKNKRKAGFTGISNIKTAGNSSWSVVANGQPPDFKAKGKGLHTTYPRIEANEHNANATLLNEVTGGKMYLWVDSFKTGWQVAGELSQTHTSRSFYPLHLSQADLVIQGHVANQHQYDELVVWVSGSQNNLLAATEYTGSDFKGVNFSLFRPQGINTFDHFRPVKYKVAITNIASGHERFVFAPAFTLTCKVLYDYTRNREDLVRVLDIRSNYHKIFGDYSSPEANIDASAGGEKSVTTQKKAKAKAKRRATRPGQHNPKGGL